MKNLFTTRSKNLFGIALVPLAFLSGCGGATQTGVLPEDGDYVYLSTIQNSTSDFAGVGLRTGQDGGIKVVEGDGSYSHSSGSIQYDDGYYDFSNSGGFSGTLALDSSGASLTDTSEFYDGQYYDYLLPVRFNYTRNGKNYSTTGFVGIPTATENVPTSGTATYYGDATGTVIAHSNYFELSNGNSRFDVDFNGNLVDVTMSGFTVTDGEYSVTAPLDLVTISDMAISGNTFTGGRLSTSLYGVPVYLTGSSVTTNAKGMFFGWNYSGENPAEIAGVSVTEGADGQLVFTFIGD